MRRHRNLYRNVFIIFMLFLFSLAFGAQAASNKVPPKTKIQKSSTTQAQKIIKISTPYCWVKPKPRLNRF